MKRKIRILQEYIESLGYAITQEKMDPTIQLDEKYINVWWNNSERATLYYLLHEAGHAQQYKNPITLKRFHYAVENKKTNTNIFKVHIIHQEIDAWQKGIKIAKKLNLKINVLDYEKFAAEKLMTYINYYTNKCN